MILFGDVSDFELWPLLVLGIFFPAGLLAAVSRHPVLNTLALLQGIAMCVSLRAVQRSLRRQGLHSDSVSALTSLAYFPVCFATNILWALASYLIVRVGLLSPA